MAWNMFENGTRVTVDPETRLGRELSQKLLSMGLDPLSTIMTVQANRLEPVQSEKWFDDRKEPHVIVQLPNGMTIDTEPVALAHSQ